MAGTAQDVSVLVTAKLLVEQPVVATVVQAKLKIVMDQVSAGQRAGLVMASLIVMISSMVLT